MQDRSIEFYDLKMKEEIKNRMITHKEYFIERGISIEQIMAIESLTDLSDRYAISDADINQLIIGAIQSLIFTYTLDDVTAERERTRRSIFRPCRYSRYQEDLADKIDKICNHSTLSQMKSNPENLQPYIVEIKACLETGLLDRHLHIQDDFLKIVKVIATQTEGLGDWAFSPVANERLQNERLGVGPGHAV